MGAFYSFDDFIPTRLVGVQATSKGQIRTDAKNNFSVENIAHYTTPAGAANLCTETFAHYIKGCSTNARKHEANHQYDFVCKLDDGN
ncbi:hypothetical protein [Paracnuella aquatica]|uniref:hypothetical protein n=1 Tax=Paracnuella aquatica TaxID=2268757 RepID=UPI000F50D0F2|nr:hypothetical protein [Paracnuella aquatica]RPD47452.1 hypothetical protein DRJ53_11425 [Paracnuella aquatica]